MKAYLLTFGALAAIFAALWAMTPDPDAEPARPEACGSREMAFVMSQRVVRQELRAPRTARFPPAINGRDVRVHAVERCVFEVIAHVDASNAFGAEIRSRYTVRMRYNPVNATWSARELMIR